MIDLLEFPALTTMVAVVRLPLFPHAFSPDVILDAAVVGRRHFVVGPRFPDNRHQTVVNDLHFVHGMFRHLQNFLEKVRLYVFDQIYRSNKERKIE